MTAPYIKLDVPLNCLASVCRGCLADSGEMKNMYEWDLHNDFFDLTAIETFREPGVSEMLCLSCEMAMMNCKKFRDRCRLSDNILKTSLAAQDQKIAQITTNNQVTCKLKENKLLIKITAPKTESQIHLPCPYYCTEKYLKKTHLEKHLKKEHSVPENFAIELQYFCSEPTCVYHETSAKNKFFTGRKFLNQHMNKMHKTKSYYCKNCHRRFATEPEIYRHAKICNFIYICQLCDLKYSTNEQLMVHLKRKHPEIHENYKKEKAEKRKQQNETETKRIKTDNVNKIADYNETFGMNDEKSIKTQTLMFSESPKKSFATQIPEDIKNDVTLPSWQSKTDFETKTDEISTQTAFEDLLSLKSQNSEDEFYSEAVALSDIQTQTFPLEFGLSRSNKETQSYKTSQTQSPDLSIKETQTCFCHYDSPRPNFRLFDSLSSSPASINLTSTETQTNPRMSVKTDVLLSFNSAETQTCFDDSSNDSM